MWDTALASQPYSGGGHLLGAKGRRRYVCTNAPRCCSACKWVLCQVLPVRLLVSVELLRPEVLVTADFLPFSNPFFFGEGAAKEPLNTRA